MPAAGRARPHGSRARRHPLAAYQAPNVRPIARGQNASFDAAVGLVERMRVRDLVFAEQNFVGHPMNLLFRSANHHCGARWALGGSWNRHASSLIRHRMSADRRIRGPSFCPMSGGQTLLRKLLRMALRAPRLVGRQRQIAWRFRRSHRATSFSSCAFTLLVVRMILP